MPKNIDRCVKCHQSNFLSLTSRANDSNYYYWQENGKKLEGNDDEPDYMPTFSSITDSEGCDFTICIECGWIRDLNLKKLKEDVYEAFNKPLPKPKNIKIPNGIYTYIYKILNNAMM